MVGADDPVGPPCKERYPHRAGRLLEEVVGADAHTGPPCKERYPHRADELLEEVVGADAHTGPLNSNLFLC